MFKNVIDYLSGLSWLIILAFVLLAVSVGYMLVGLLGFAIYWILIALFFLGASYREAPKTITKTVQGTRVTAKK
jgi:hypothetical protein